MKWADRLEERVLSFATNICREVEMNGTDSSSLLNLQNQITRSATSVCLNYGEARSAESPKDYVHKMKVALKELSETRMAIKLLMNIRKGRESELKALLDECGELVGIFIASINTARRKF